MYIYIIRPISFKSEINCWFVSWIISTVIMMLINTSFPVYYILSASFVWSIFCIRFGVVTNDFYSIKQGFYNLRVLLPVVYF